VTVVGVDGMGGLGKTTLALALSNDKDIKGRWGISIYPSSLKLI